MKDEACGVPIKIFVGLKAKMYTFAKEVEYDRMKDPKKVWKYPKKVSRSYQKFCSWWNKIKKFRFQKYFVQWLHMRHKTNRSQSKDYRIGTYRINKLSFLLRWQEIYTLKIDTLGYHMFINLHFNHTKMILSIIDNLFWFQIVIEKLIFQKCILIE